MVDSELMRMSALDAALKLVPEPRTIVDVLKAAERIELYLRTGATQIEAVPRKPRDIDDYTTTGPFKT
jgi:hypothetical protein